MKVLFLVDGAAGSGKSDLVNYISNTKRYTVTKIDKYTTRKKRHLEEAKKSDLKFVSEKDFAQLEAKQNDYLFQYTYGGHKYGFYKSALEKAITEYQSTFVIVRNQDLIQRLSELYSDKVLVVPVFIYTDMGLIESRLKNDGYDDDNIKFRMERSELVFQDYLENDIYKNVIIYYNKIYPLFTQKNKDASRQISYIR